MWLRSPVKMTKSGAGDNAFTAAIALGSVPCESGLGAPLKPQWVSDNCTK
ncbi:hypothetical protein R8510_02572 [Ralstonia chuxiongensis]|nr:hypothetical protein R8510_02572 [Ralstonia chuxiongensis]